MTVRPQFPLSGKYGSLLLGISDSRGITTSRVSRGDVGVCAPMVRLLVYFLVWRLMAKQVP